MDGKRYTHILRQSFVTAGVSINVASGAITLGFANGLIEQLNASGSTIPTDESYNSWIASVPIFTMFLGNLIVIPIMGKYGRRNANLISIAINILAWICVIFSTSIELLLFARALQGIHIGMSVTLGSLLIGEYTSPKKRGSFLMSISVLISIAYMTIHSLGFYIKWQNAAIVSAAISIVNIFIVVYSPESPSWLACQGRYGDSKRVFRWLRGDGEEDELRKMIETNIMSRESRAEAKVSADTFAKKVQKSLIYFRNTMIKREFYMPMIVMLHIYAIVSWGGMYILTVYTSDFFRKIVGNDTNLQLQIISIDAQRVIVNIISIYFVQKIKRRTLLFITLWINIVTLLMIAAYSYSREKNVLPINHPMIPILLSHCIMFTIAAGTTPLTYIISGEIFPLQFKNLAGGLSNVTYSTLSFFSVKSIPYCFNSFGIHGTFCIYVLILIYSFIVTWFWLPETKDKTLQDIEEELKEKPLKDLKSVQPLALLADRD